MATYDSADDYDSSSRLYDSLSGSATGTSTSSGLVAATPLIFAVYGGGQPPRRRPEFLELSAQAHSAASAAGRVRGRANRPLVVTGLTSIQAHVLAAAALHRTDQARMDEELLLVLAA